MERGSRLWFFFFFFFLGFLASVSCLLDFVGFCRIVLDSLGSFWSCCSVSWPLFSGFGFSVSLDLLFCVLGRFCLMRLALHVLGECCASLAALREYSFGTGLLAKRRRSPLNSPHPPAVAPAATTPNSQHFAPRHLHSSVVSFNRDKFPKKKNMPPPKKKRPPPASQQQTRPIARFWRSSELSAGQRRGLTCRRTLGGRGSRLACPGWDLEIYFLRIPKRSI